MPQMLAKAMRKDEVLKGVEDVVRSRMVAKHTVEYEDSFGTVHMRYVQTTLYSRFADGTIQLANGGYATPTTKKRINDYLPWGWSIFQEKGAWYLHDGPVWANGGESHRFVEGMRMVPYKEGWHIRYPTDKAAEREDKRAALIMKLISSYVAEVRKMCKDKTLPRPELGDCLICVAEKGTTFKPREGTDHLMSHLEEKYVHGALIYNALQWAGYEDRQMVFVYGNWNTPNCVRRYLRFRFGLAG